ncbi:hypothetical protein [Jannaschia sp. LMIT008]|uniref:hypothetical protein n=1 Tax=Jannaschia maritima TaxID=3032585 RepID=UPI0028121958|nr:hypothetical protein [Jannaschia sp. LMIT008]
MQNEWIIEVLGDLRAFAATNDLPGLASELEDTIVAATVELAQDGWAEDGAERHERTTGTVLRAVV